MIETISAETRREMETLRGALENAKKKINEQNAKLDELTSPPFIYATVIALSGWRDNKTSSLKTYTDTMGDKININTKKKTFAGFNLGDVLSFINEERNSNAIAQIKEGKKFIVVGFINDEKIAVQIDDGVVIIDTPKSMRSCFEVIETGRVGMINTAVIVCENTYYEVLTPEGQDVNPGDTVTVIKETMQIVEVASVQIGGDIAYVNRSLNTHFVEVEYQSVSKVVFSGRYGDKLEKGDRVVLDQTTSVVVSNLGKDDDRFKFTIVSDVEWDDIAGLENAKAQMIDAIELPYRNPEIVAHYHKKPVKGVLLYGPPGCGKTMLGKATATAIARVSNNDKKGNGFIYIKGPEILERYVGVAEAAVRSLFQRARQHKKETGVPSVLFVDEADALLSKRGSGISSDIEKTIVPMFCTEMDGLEEFGALVLLASNRPDILDPAIMRDGRVDRKIKIDRPTVESASEIFLLNLKGVPLNNGYSYEALAKFASAEMFSSNRVLYKIKINNQGTRDFLLKDIINGAMVAGVVEKAISLAISRDISNQERSGLKKEDLLLAINLVEQQNRDLNHTDELSDFTHNFRDDIVDIQRLCQSTC